MRKAFDVEDINLDELIATAMEDPAVITGEIKSFRGINFEDLHLAYRQFCTSEQIDNSPFDLGEVITFYNKTVADLPDHNAAEGTEAARHDRNPRQGRQSFADCLNPITGASGWH